MESCLKKLAIILFLAAFLRNAGAEENLAYQTAERQEERLAMVKYQIEARGVNNPQVLQAMRKIPRHLFIPGEYQSIAYGDHPVPIGYGQTISQPYIVALMTQILNLKQKDRVLEIGTGSGYQIAVLAEITGEVYTIEIIENLYKTATERLTRLGYKNVKTLCGDGYFGWKEHAPYDVIIVTAASDHIPPPLLGQLKKGGRMCIPVGPPNQVQRLVLVHKDEAGRVYTKDVLTVRFVPLIRSH